jgi:hypothetical protein
VEIKKTSHVSGDTLLSADTFPMLDALCCDGSEKDRVALVLSLLRQGLSDPDQTTEGEQSHSLW